MSYSIGNDVSKHHDTLNSFELVSLGEVYPGIRVQLRAAGSNVEKIFTIAPNHEPRSLLIRLDGAERLELGADGQLIAHTRNGPVELTPPVAYQDAETGRQPVDAKYALDSASLTYRFVVGTYDRSRPLVIDPLLQSTYLGGNDYDVPTAIAIHPATGEVYVAGITSSTDFPKVAGAEQPTRSGTGGNYDASFDAFVTRLNATLTTRLQSTYLGGSDLDEATAIAIHPATGDVYIAGSTRSTNFPKTAGAEQPTRGTEIGNTSDGFVTRLSASLTSQIQSTYVGGNGEDHIWALAIHPVTGEVYVAGNANSTDFPKTTGSEQADLAGNHDAFVTRLNATLTSRLQSTYLGGSSYDQATALAIHPASGEVYVAGFTSSTDFPNTLGAGQSMSGGAPDAFVTRLDAGLTNRLQSTYVGGSGADLAFAIAVAAQTGDIYVAGRTTSATDFPNVTGAEQIVNGGGEDAFVTRLNAELTELVQSSYLGGTGNDQAVGVAVHPVTGDVFVAGFTKSMDFPKVQGGDQVMFGGGTYDSFATRLNASLANRLQSTYIGAPGYDRAYAMTIHPATAEVYVCGETTSPAYPNVSGAEQTMRSGPSDAFVSRYSLDLLALDVVPQPLDFMPRLKAPVGSSQVSNPAPISGIATNVPVSIWGGSFAQYCISSSNDCSCDLLGFTNAPSTIGNGQYICVRQIAPFTQPGVALATVGVGSGFGRFLVTTGGLVTQCTLDLDGNGAIDALTDGLMILRALFGLTGTVVTNAAVGIGATRTSWAQIQPYLNGNCGTSFSP